MMVDLNFDQEAPPPTGPAQEVRASGRPEGPGPAKPEGPAPEGPSPGRPKRRRWWVVLVVVVCVLAILVGGAFAAAEYTAKSTFCITCHEMDPYYASWQKSTHKEVPCIKCHIAPGFLHFVETKAYALREVYVHVTGQVKAPLAVTANIPNASCERCHTVPPPDVQLGNASFSHQKHQTVQCIDCHVRLVHKGVPGKDYVNPASMASCLGCHDPKTVPGGCGFCHTAPTSPGATAATATA
jgi:nitrate/TMAO reductase-like tetraheme cytochrome c subunit